jgi:hypothetical protein
MRRPVVATVEASLDEGRTRCPYLPRTPPAPCCAISPTLRDRTHGGVSSRREKEELFGKAVPLIDPYARRAVHEINQGLLLGTGEVTGTGVRPQAAGGIEAEWTLTWPLQQTAGIAPVTLRAHYGTGFHHPHLRSGTTATGRSTCSMRHRQPPSSRHCGPWQQPTCTTSSSSSAATSG